MTRNPKLLISDIMESINDIDLYTKNMNREDFANDRKTQDAVLKRLEIIGEASKNILEEFKSKYQEIPWKELSGTRDIIIHQYFRVNLSLVWEVITDDLPELKVQLTAIKNKIN